MRRFEPCAQNEKLGGHTSTFDHTVLRPEDLLSLRFRGVNLVLESPPGESPRLVREQAGQPALLIVEFSPQHIAERSFTEGEQGELLELRAPPIASAMADPTRLAFRIPDNVPHIPLTLEGLLAWAPFESAVTANALPDPPGAHDPVGLTFPTAEQTSIEVPFGLILSPDKNATWEHRIPAVMQEGRAELWHTRLASRNGSASNAPPLPPPPVRAIAQTHATRTFADVLSDGQSLAPPLTPDERTAIAQASADFSAQEAPRPLTVQHLMLSALGAWTDVAGSWDTIQLGGLVGWRHVVSMGRDQYVRTEKQGFLYPWGHRASIIEITERKFRDSPSGERAAYLGTRRFISVREPERFFDATMHTELPFDSVRVPTLVTAEPLRPGEHVIRGIDGNPLQFAMSATDRTKQQRHFAMPLLFVSADEMPALAGIVAEYDQAGALRTVAFNDQNIGFAPLGEASPNDPADSADPAAAGGNTPDLGPTTLKTASIQFSALADDRLDPPFRPRLQRAQVQIPAVEQLADAGGASSFINYHPTYIDSGFVTATPEVFARIESGPAVQLSAAKAGGLAAPNFRLTGLSRAHGAVPNADQLATQALGTDAIEGLAGKLLGVIDLGSIIEPPADAKELPKLNAGASATGQQVSFEWAPRLKRLPEPLFDVPIEDPPKAHALLKIKGVVKRSTGEGTAPASIDMLGTFGPFGIKFAGVLAVQFSSVDFHTITGSKPKFDIHLKSFEFTDDLAFVGKLATLLSNPNSFGGTGPIVGVTPEGVTAGVAFAVPTIGLGAFTLQNLALSASVSLFFAERLPEVRFALSSREHPFLVSYSLIGGGGFFALTARTAPDASKSIELEAAFELGAVAAINLVVARGEAQIMIGIYLKLGPKMANGVILPGPDGKPVQVAVLSGYVRIFGALEVLSLITISVQIYLKLTYDGTVATGSAEVTVMVRVLMFSKSVSFRVQRSFNTQDLGVPVMHALASDSTFASNVVDSDWSDYCEAFA